MTRPKVTADLSLAPVAANIDLNLQRLRGLSTREEIFSELGLELNLGSTGHTREERAEQVLRFALRDVDMHGWHAEMSDDATRIHVHGGSVTLDLGLSAALEEYITG
jgi:hypothetical protein